MNISSTSGHQRPDPAEFFKRVDTDGSGGISKDELAALMKKRSQKTDDVQAPSSAQAPTLDQVFAAADADGDGQINQAEMQTAMKAMHPHHHGNRASSFSGSADTLDSILSTLKSQDNGESASLTADQRKAIEQIVTDLKNSGTYTAQGTADSSGSAGFFGTNA